MKILVVTPMSREKTNFQQALTRRTSTQHQYVVTGCGVGKAMAAAAVAICLEKEHYDMVAVIGYAAAGAGGGLHTGDMVIPSSARYHDVHAPEWLVPELTSPYVLEGGDGAVILTGDSFVDAPLASSVRQRFGLDGKVLFDMEATAVCQVATSYSTPVAVVKMVSDIPEDGDTDFSFDDFVNSHSDFASFVDCLEAMQLK